MKEMFTFRGSKSLAVALLLGFPAFVASAGESVPKISLPPFLITEFMAVNNGKGTNALRDEDAEGSDWIEIYNTLGSVSNLAGWFLTDTAADLTKWRFPEATVVPAHSYLIVFASGKNRTNAPGRLHTNFRLNRAGEYLALVNPQTNVVSAFSPAFPPQRPGLSYGRDRASPNVLGFYQTPTPGADNATSGTGFGSDVIFSRLGGTFTGSFQLTLSTTNPGAVITYTLVTNAQNALVSAVNLSNAFSLIYTGAITITNTVQVRARTLPPQAGYFPGPPRTESYVLLGHGAAEFTSTLPIVVIHMIGSNNLAARTGVDDSAIVECFDNEGGTSSLTRPQLVSRAGVNRRGSDTLVFPKPSISIELWDEFNRDRKESFLGLPAESDWVLYAPNAFDLSLMHNVIPHQLAREMGHYSSRTRFVEVFLGTRPGGLTIYTESNNANMGDYLGVYILKERVKRGPNRVNIDRLLPEHTNAAAITGGYILNADRIDANERSFAAGGVVLTYVEPPGPEMVTPARAAQAAYIKAYLDNMAAGLAGNALTNIASTNHYSNYLDLDATLDFHILSVALMNLDVYRVGCYITKPRGGKLIFGPVWDADRGLGATRAGDIRSFNPRTWQALDGFSCGNTDFGADYFGGAVPITWLGRWFADVDFWQRWVDRYQTWRTSVLETNHIAAMIDGFGQDVRGVQWREQKRWTGIGSSDTSPRTGTVVNCSGTYTHTFPGTYQGEVDFQKQWLLERLHFFDTNLLNRPAFSVAEGPVLPGAVVSLTDSGKPGTVIYYTLDGTDPRGFQGTTNSAAFLYTQPLRITDNVRVRARAVNAGHSNMTGVVNVGSHNPVVSTPWSGDIAATYFITPPALAITELMYHPRPSSEPAQNPDDFEYLELKNIGTNTLSLPGFKFTNGIDFTFTATHGVTNLAAGDCVLIVRNLAAFASRYGARTNIAGEYRGDLADDGERLTLVGRQLEPILDFVYDGQWYPLGDGLGFSLTAVNPNAPPGDWSNRTNWRTSNSRDGSPGVGEEPASNLPVVFINEALTRAALPQSNAIELHNPGTDGANIGGWFLTDDPARPMKYQIPLNTIIPAGGYQVFDESHFNTGPNAFSLGPEGGDIHLFSADAGVLGSYSHGFHFGAAAKDVSFGRHLTSQGEEHFVPQATNTLGLGNSLPRVGPVIISEIMYHPPPVSGDLLDNSIDEFIELRNLADTNVALFDPLRSSNTWRLSAAVHMDFPTNVTMAPASFLVAVRFDPATNAAQLSAFRAKYELPAAVPVFGPYQGALDNSAASLRLERPDCPTAAGAVRRIVADQLDYQKGGAWPEAAGSGGASLQRLVLHDYGNDPTNWIAARPGAGRDFPGGTPPVMTQQPSNAVAVVGDTTRFTVAVSGTNVGLQWRFNGQAISGATNATLTLAPIQYSHGGIYDLVAFNSGGASVSSSARLTVLPPIIFSIQPADQVVLPGAHVTLVALASGGGPIRYQWRHEGTNIPSATNATYDVGDVSLTNCGSYRVSVTDGLTTSDSSNAFVYVLLRPGFAVQPISQTVLQGGSATFSGVATGGPPITYRLVRQGQGVATNLTGVFTLTNVQPLNNQLSNSIRLMATNLASGISGVSSLAVSLMILPDFDRDGMADGWETNYPGFSTNDAADAFLDFDGDGMSNRDEFIAGTNPTDALSVLKLVPAGTNRAVLRFVAQTNISYTLQSRTDLSFSTWSNLTSITAQTFVRTVQVNVPNPPPAMERYYRVLTPAPATP